MADISKCNNTKCPLKENCYRYTVKSGFWQSYADFQFTITEDGKVECDYFWDNKDYKKDDNKT
jgi:hypothetical protein